MLLPYASDRPPRNPPLAAVSLVLINFLVFGIVALVVRLRGADSPVIWYANLSLVPSSLRWYAPFTYAFLHEDVSHLSANMLFLWVFGGSVEDAIGWKRFLALYVGAAAATGLLQVGMTYALPGADRTMPIVGASGAVSAILGVFAVRFYRSRIRFIGLPFRIPAVALLALVLVGEMAFVLWQLLQRGHASAGQAAAHWSHIGGFVLGTLWAMLTRMMRAGQHEYLVSDALVEMERGSPLAAARRWEAVLQDRPDDLRAEAELGRAWGMVGDREQTLAHYRRAIDGLLKSGDRAEAASRYAEMTEFVSDVILGPADLLSIASALEERGEYGQAVSALRSLVAAYPDSREAEMARMRIAVIELRRLNQPARAAESLEAFLQAHPQSEWRAYAEDLLRAARGRS